MSVWAGSQARTQASPVARVIGCDGRLREALCAAATGPACRVSRGPNKEYLQADRVPIHALSVPGTPLAVAWVLPGNLH